MKTALAPYALCAVTALSLYVFMHTRRWRVLVASLIVCVLSFVLAVHIAEGRS